MDSHSHSHSHSQLLDWVTAHNGEFDRSALTFAWKDGFGWGAFALRDLQEGHSLFTLPRELTLSTRTSSLPSLIGEADWKKHSLHVGWSGLILCLMWEAAQGTSSRWSTYLASLPIAFDTPMFWGSEDLEQLRGTSVFDKIGRKEAENDYLDKIVPLIKSRPDLFGDEFPNLYYSLEIYHIMGSRILSRSFHVEAQSGIDNYDWIQTQAHVDAEMSLDEPEPSPRAPDHINSDEAKGDEDTDDEDDPANVAMVPLADLLNARSGWQNARLYYDQHRLRMTTTTSILEGEQIWNTYGDPPNADLLRCYGHVDQLLLGNDGLGNPADIVEIRADLVLSSFEQKYPERAGPRSSERVDWWLEEGGDDVFVVNYFPNVLPEEMTSFVRLLIMSAPKWEKAKRKSRFPKPKVDGAVLAVVADVVRRRLAEYPTTIEDDEALLGMEKEKSIPLNLKNAVVVRLCEKRILDELLQEVIYRLEGGDPRAPQSSSANRKRKADGTDTDDDGRRAVKR